MVAAESQDAHCCLEKLRFFEKGGTHEFISTFLFRNSPFRQHHSSCDFRNGCSAEGDEHNEENQKSIRAKHPSKRKLNLTIKSKGETGPKFVAGQAIEESPGGKSMLIVMIELADKKGSPIWSVSGKMILTLCMFIYPALDRLEKWPAHRSVHVFARYRFYLGACPRIHGTVIPAIFKMVGKGSWQREKSQVSVFKKAVVLLFIEDDVVEQLNFNELASRFQFLSDHSIIISGIHLS